MRCPARSTIRRASTCSAERFGPGVIGLARVKEVVAGVGTDGPRHERPVATDTASGWRCFEYRWPGILKQGKTARKEHRRAQPTTHMGWLLSLSLSPRSLAHSQSPPSRPVMPTGYTHASARMQANWTSLVSKIASGNASVAPTATTTSLGCLAPPPIANGLRVGMTRGTSG